MIERLTHDRIGTQITLTIEIDEEVSRSEIPQQSGYAVNGDTLDYTNVFLGTAEIESRTVEQYGKSGRRVNVDVDSHLGWLVGKQMDSPVLLGTVTAIAHGETPA